METFSLGGTQYPYKAPAGKKGRRATAYLLAALGTDFSSGDQSKFMQVITELFMKDDFEYHLPALLGVDAKTLEEQGDLGEVLQATLGQLDRIFRAFRTDEVDTALKNSPDEQEGEEG